MKVTSMPKYVENLVKYKKFVDLSHSFFLHLL